MDGERCIGVRCDRKGGEVYADVVILADGVNSHAGAQGRLPRRAQGRQRGAGGQGDPLHARRDDPASASTSSEEEGVVIEMMGTVTEGMMGTGFLYTNKESLTIGVGCMLSDFKANPQQAPRPTRCWRS